jgi:AraC-like DNA-binding protein
MSRRKWTREETQWIRDNRESKTIAEMCEHFGCAISTLYRKFRRMRLKGGRRTASQLGDEQLAWLRANFANTPNDEIAQRLGISLTTMHRITRREGLTKSKEYVEALKEKGRKAAMEHGKATYWQAQRIGAIKQHAEYVAKGIRPPGCFDGRPIAEVLGPEKAAEALAKSLAKRRKSIERDKRRVALGLEPLGGIVKAVKLTKQEIHVRSTMKHVGYKVFKGDPVIYYDSRTPRSEARENFAQSIGLAVIHINKRVTQ